MPASARTHELGNAPSPLGVLAALRWAQVRVRALGGSEALCELLVRWISYEICAYKDLAEEGARMRHCVVIHARDCAAGATSIWSLRASDGMREVSRVTLRVTVRTREVVEARELANRPISQAAARMIARWSARHHLRVGQLIVR